MTASEQEIGDSSQASLAADAVQAGGLNSANVAAVLRDAADLIEPPGKWIQGRLGDPETGCCAVGAIIYAAGNCDDTYFACVAAMENLLGTYASIWNDTKGRTQAEVVAALRIAAALADGAGHGTASITDAGKSPGTNPQKAGS